MVTYWPAYRLRFRATFLLGMIACLCLFAVSVSAQVQDYRDDDSEDLVLAVFTDQERLSAGVFAVQQNARYYLPVSALSEVFGFYVDIDLERRFAEGWAMAEENKFSIDAVSGKLIYKKQSVDLPAEAFLNANIADDDIYILLEVFEQIWPLSLDVSLGSLILRVTPDDKLPFQKLLERRLRQKRLETQKELEVNKEEVELPFFAYPYQLVGKPSIDISTSAGYDARLDNPEYRTTLNGVQDLAYASADYSLTLAQTGGAFDKPENLRLRFRRQNIHEGALPFGLEDTQWGDVRLKNRELIAKGSSGRGFIFSTQKNDFNNEFDRITVDGTGTPGWEVELYINNELIDFGVIDDDGIYRFEDVSIGYGNNRVRTVLYGPQGQVREKTENYFYQSNMVKRGENQFSGGIVEENKDLIPLDERDTARREGLAANLYGARGVTDKLTVFASANTIHNRIGRENISSEYATVGAIASFKNTLTRAEAYKQLDGGHAVDIRTLSDFKGFKVNTQTAFYSDFESPDAQDGPGAKEFEFDVDIKKIFPTVLGTIGLEGGVEYLRRKDGRAVATYTTRQSLGTGGTRVTNSTRTNISDGEHTTTTGRLSSTTRMQNWRLRNTLNYKTFPEIEGSSIQTELRYGRNRDYSGAVSVQKNFENQETIVGLQLTRDFEKFLGSVQADWSSAFGTSFMVRASTALGPFSPDGSYIAQSDPLRNSGPISAFIYRDMDYDGVYSDGDEPVPDTKVAIGRRVPREETNEEGYLAEINSYVQGAIDVSVNSNSIDDPYLISANPGYRVYPRPGVMHAVEFPLIETGAIDGTLRWSSKKPIAGLVLELMNSDAEIIQKSKTASDGYFTFERIPPAKYTIRASSESGLNIPFTYIELTPDNLFQFGINITADDLSREAEVDLGIGLDDKGVMKVKNILSLAKGAKSKKGSGLKKIQTEAPTVSKPIQGGSKKTGAANVSSVRIGEHPDKIRVVLDLSAQTSYTLDYDLKSNSVFVELPYASWSAKENWKAGKKSLIGSYTVERVGAGVRLILGVQEGVKIGASGLLNASGGKKDRLYIDIERK